MEIQKVIKLIQKKIKEHEVEMTGCQTSLDAAQMSLTSNNRPDITKIAQLATVKDKMIFHKACKMALEDLLEEVK